MQTQNNRTNMVRKTFSEWLLELRPEISGDYFRLFSSKQRNKFLNTSGYIVTDKLTFAQFISAGIPLYSLDNDEKWVELFRANPKDLNEIEKIFFKTKNRPKIKLVW